MCLFQLWGSNMPLYTVSFQPVRLSRRFSYTVENKKNVEFHQRKNCAVLFDRGLQTTEKTPKYTFENKTYYVCVFQNVLYFSNRLTPPNWAPRVEFDIKQVK